MPRSTSESNAAAPRAHDPPRTTATTTGTSASRRATAGATGGSPGTAKSPADERGSGLPPDGGLDAADALGRGDEDVLDQARNLAEERVEVPPADHEHAHRRLGDHRGAARLAVEQAHLAEVVAGAELVLLLRGHLDAGRAVQDEEELVARLARAGQRHAG